MRHLLMPYDQESAQEFLRLAIAEAGRFGVKPDDTELQALRDQVEGLTAAAESLGQDVYDLTS